MKRLIFLVSLLLFSVLIFCIDVQGSQSGTWTPDNNPYNVVGNITIPVGENLTIQAGVNIVIDGDYGFTAEGTITAIGEESNIIEANSNLTGIVWKGFRMENEENVSIFEFCKIENAEKAINSINSPVNITNCHLNENECGVNVFAIGNSNPQEVNIIDNLIENCLQSGVYINEGSNTLVENNEITQCALDNSPRGAVYLSNQSVGGSCNPVIDGNHIHHNIWQGMTAFDVTGAGNINPWVVENIIEYNLTGIFCYYANGVFKNNTISNNFVTGNPNSGAGVMVYGASSNPIFAENIITGNYTGFYIINEATANLGNVFNASSNDDGLNHIYDNIAENGQIYSVYSNTNQDITAQNNIWDSEDYDEIAETIIDVNDGSGTGEVCFHPIYSNEIMLGDVDENGVVQAYDAAIVLNYSIGLDPIPEIDPIPWEENRILAADVDGNGEIQSFDASLILQYSVGLITSFPVEDRANFIAPVGNVESRIEEGFLIFSAKGNLMSLDINFQSSINEVETEYLFAKNKNRIALASAETIFGDFLKIKLYEMDNLNYSVLCNNEKIRTSIKPLENEINLDVTNISCFPNPFNPEISISYNLNSDGIVCIEIFNVKGQFVHRLINEHQTIGEHKIKWNGIDVNNNSVSSGVYYFKIEKKGSFTATRKIILLK